MTPASACCSAKSLEAEVGLTADLVHRKGRQVMGDGLGRVVVAIVLAEAIVAEVAADTVGIAELVVFD